MTISSTVRIAGPYIGSGAATVFPFAFKVFAAAEMQVAKLNTTSNVETILTLTTDYTVQLNGDQNGTPGGTITLPAVLASGYNLTITSDIANLQPTDLTNQGGFYPEVITDALDRATIQIQQLDQNSRAIKIPLSDGVLDMTTPVVSARQGKYLAFDSLGLPVVSAGTGNDSALRTDLANATAVSAGSRLSGFRQTGTGATARTVDDKLKDTVSVKDFGAVGDAVTDDTAAIQAAINYLEQQSGRGGIAFVPRGQYLCTNKIRIGSFVTLRGENDYSSSLFWNSTYTSGNCIELGPNQSGTGNPNYVFGARLENLYLIGQNVDRGALAAMVYTQGAHQFSGLFNVWINNFRNIGVYYDQGLGGPACFQMHGVELQGGVTAPASGSTIGVLSNGAGAVIDAQMVICQGDASNLMSSGINMTKDNLNLSGGHFENCSVGILLQQNETSIRVNGLNGVTGHSTVPTLIQIAATNNLSYSISNSSNVTVSTVTLTFLEDLKNAVTLSAYQGTSVADLSSDSFSLGLLKSYGTSIASGGANRGSFSSRNPTNTHQINIGGDTTTAGWIQGWRPGSGSWDFSLNPAGGNVGIGIATPLNIFHCNGAMRYTTRPIAAVVTNIGVDANGDVREATSSLRYKHSIVPYTRGLTDLLQLQPKQFCYNGEEIISAGFIAEDIEELGFNEYVIRDSDGNAHAIPYGNMVAMLVNAIKELNTKFEAYVATHP